MLYALKIASGMLLGIICKYLCSSLSSMLLEKRGKRHLETDAERTVMTAASAAAGGAVMYLCSSLPEALYLYLLLIVGEAVL